MSLPSCPIGYNLCPDPIFSPSCCILCPLLVCQNPITSITPPTIPSTAEIGPTPPPPTGTIEVPQPTPDPLSSSPVSASTRASPTSNATSTQHSTTACPSQQSDKALPTHPSGGAPCLPSRPVAFPILVAIGGLLVMIIIILTIMLCHGRRRRSRTSTEGLPTHDGVAEPCLDDGPVTGIQTHPSIQC